MKKQLSLSLLLTVAGIAVFAFAEDKPGESTVTPDVEHVRIQLRGEIAELRTKISELESKNQSLEDRLNKLESTVQTLQHPRLQPLSSQGGSFWELPPPAPQPSQSLQPLVPQSGSPKIWGQREINGWKFYIIPCEQQDMAAK